MTAKKRSGKMTGAVGSAPSGTNTKRKDGPTQAKHIKGAITCPCATGYSKLKGAITG